MARKGRAGAEGKGVSHNHHLLCPCSVPEGDPESKQGVSTEDWRARLQRKERDCHRRGCGVAARVGNAMENVAEFQKLRNPQPEKSQECVNRGEGWTQLSSCPEKRLLWEQLLSYCQWGMPAEKGLQSEGLPLSDKTIHEFPRDLTPLPGRWEGAWRRSETENDYVLLQRLSAKLNAVSTKGDPPPSQGTFEMSGEVFFCWYNVGGEMVTGIY